MKTAFALILLLAPLRLQAMCALALDWETGGGKAIQFSESAQKELRRFGLDARAISREITSKPIFILQTVKPHFYTIAYILTEKQPKTAFMFMGVRHQDVLQIKSVSQAAIDDEMRFLFEYSRVHGLAGASLDIQPGSWHEHSQVTLPGWVEARLRLRDGLTADDLARVLRRSRRFQLRPGANGADDRLILDSEQPLGRFVVSLSATAQRVTDVSRF